MQVGMTENAIPLKIQSENAATTRRLLNDVRLPVVAKPSWQLASF